MSCSWLGELIRLMRTNSCQEWFEKHAEFTMSKLLERGYDRKALRSIRNNFSWSTRDVHLAERPVSAKSRIIARRLLLFCEAFLCQKGYGHMSLVYCE